MSTTPTPSLCLRFKGKEMAVGKWHISYNLIHAVTWSLLCLFHSEVWWVKKRSRGRSNLHLFEERGRIITLFNHKLNYSKSVCRLFQHWNLYKFSPWRFSSRMDVPHTHTHARTTIKTNMPQANSWCNRKGRGQFFLFFFLWFWWVSKCCTLRWEVIF